MWQIFFSPEIIQFLKDHFFIFSLPELSYADSSTTGKTAYMLRWNFLQSYNTHCWLTHWVCRKPQCLWGQHQSLNTSWMDSETEMCRGQKLPQKHSWNLNTFPFYLFTCHFQNKSQKNYTPRIEILGNSLLLHSVIATFRTEIRTVFPTDWDFRQLPFITHSARQAPENYTQTKITYAINAEKRLIQLSACQAESKYPSAPPSSSFSVIIIIIIVVTITIWCHHALYHLLSPTLCFQVLSLWYHHHYHLNYHHYYIIYHCHYLCDNH